MTAEIALLNKLAVTLSADSAVTLGLGSATKVYNSADKIFEATNFDPIGIMIYNVPEHQGIPLESIIKAFRDRHCNQSYETVFLFADAFMDHLQEISAPRNIVFGAIFASLSSRFEQLKQLHSAVVDHIIKGLADLSDEEVQGRNILASIDGAIEDALSEQRERLFNAPEQEWSVGLSTDQVVSDYGDTIGHLIDYYFSEVRLTNTARELLREIGALSLLREFAEGQQTGLVFAGFGEKEIFPSLISFETFGIVSGKLKVRMGERFDVDRTLEPEATVIPFAQQEMVDRFIYGMDHHFLQLCTTYFDGALKNLNSELSAALDATDPAYSAQLKSALNVATNAIMEEFRGTLMPDHLRSSKAQLADVIRSMPKQELAALSESLVHITSLKRKFSADAESVGGPIDVALITRAEGFVWVRRKHFFDPALNPRYFHRRYGKRIAVNGEGEQA